MTVALVWALGAAAVEPAIPELDAQRYRPPVDSRTTLWTETSGQRVSADGPTGGDLRARFALHYVNRPLVFVPDAPDRGTVALVSDVLQLDAIGAYALGRCRLALDLPVHLYSAGELTADGPGLGDLSADLRATLVDREAGRVGLATFGRLGVPTSTARAPLGSPGVVGELGGIVDVTPSDGLVAAANLGVRLAPTRELQNLTTGDSLWWKVGTGYGVRDGDAGVSADVCGQRELQSRDRAAGAPVEALLGGWGRLAGDLVLRGGIGRGITPGIGSANARVVSMLSYEPRGPDDTDDDGLVDGADRCPERAEDPDGFDDADGCPDSDDDRDSLADERDRCPRSPEDRDGFADDDGCPDPGVEVVVRVQDPRGDAVPGVRALITGPQHPIEVKGLDFVAPLHEGEYQLAASAPGFVGGVIDFQVPYPGDRVVLVLHPDTPAGPP